MPLKSTQVKSSFSFPIVAAAVLIIGAGTFLYVQKPPKAVPSNNITDLPIGQIPPAMPQDIILAKDANVIHSYTEVDKGGQQKSTIIYSAPKMGDILAQYRDYLTKNGWQITNSKLPNSQYSIQATKAGAVLTVFLNGITVSISYLPAK